MAEHVTKAGEALWVAIDDAMIDGRLTHPDCFVVARAVLDAVADDLRAEALRNLPVSLAEYVRASERSGVMIARDAGITTKHLSQMLNHHVGSLDAWVRVVHAAHPARADDLARRRQGGGEG